MNQQLVLGSPDEKFRDVLNKMTQHHLHRLYITGGCLPVNTWVIAGCLSMVYGCSQDRSFASFLLCTYVLNGIICRTHLQVQIASLLVSSPSQTYSAVSVMMPTNDCSPALQMVCVEGFILKPSKE